MEDLNACGCSRRDAIRSMVGGSLLLPGILGSLLADDSASGPLSPKASHHPARAKRVIFLFMPGGPSQVDTFDPKPELTKQNGKPSPKLYLGQKRNLLASPWKFQKYGQSGQIGRAHV